KKTQVAHNDSVTLSAGHLSPLGSQLSFSNALRIDNVVDWDSVRRKYRELFGGEIEKIDNVEETIDEIGQPLLIEDSPNSAVSFSAFMLVSVIVLITLLIAMMSDTYQRIVAQNDIE
ncbi:hypothetical protein PV326_013656, partial [Microctonus aethiopoides]